jgi:Bifunctional DNA primase/polymerase, N-terminal
LGASLRRLRLASRPLFSIVAGCCDCPSTYKEPDKNGKVKCSPGKHPRFDKDIEHGRKDATIDEATIRRWWSMWPHAGIAIDLETAGLVDIAPDSIEWHAEFIVRGLPNTATFLSGGGDGHQHYLYTRPPGCAITKINRTGEFDIQVNALAVMPPTMHASGRRYQWLVTPEDLERGV